MLTAWYAPPARAYDSDYPPYIYLAEDLSEVWQDPENLGMVNFVLETWMLSGIIISNPAIWWAEAGILDDADVVINGANGWKAAIPNLKYTLSTLEGGHLKIYFSECPNEPARISCYKVIETHDDVDYRAAYVLGAEIYLNNNYGWTSSARKAAIAHELGKFYGLYERQLIGDPDACNPDEFTAMDTLQVVNGQVVPCDAIEGPTSLDKWRVEAYWSGGAPLHADIPISAWGNGSVVTYRWHDLAWAENKHYLDFQYLNASGEWEAFVSAENYIAYIGTHMYTQDRGMGIEIDISSPEFNEIVPDGTTYHRACGWAYFKAYNTYGNGQCSMAVQLVK